MQFEPFELDKRQHRGEDMIPLTAFDLGRGFRERSILLQRLVKRLDLPPSFVKGRDASRVKRRIRADQIQSPGTAVLVGQDVFGQHDGKIDACERDQTCGAGSQIEGGHSHKLTSLFCLRRERHVPIGFQGADDIFVQGAFHTFQVVGGRVPGIPKHRAECHPIGVDQHLEPATHQGIVRDGACPFRLAGVLVLVRLRFHDDFVGQGQREIRAIITCTVIDEIQDMYPFDVRVSGVINVPTHDVIFVGIGCLFNGVVHINDAISMFNTPNGRRDELPVAFERIRLLIEKSRDFVVTVLPIQPFRQTGGGRLRC